MNTEQERADFEAWWDGLPQSMKSLLTYEVAKQAYELGRAALQSQTVIDDDHLSIVLDVYDNAMQKAFDGREFQNPCKPGTPEHKAWEKGSKEGKKKRDAGLPNSIALQSQDREGAVQRAIDKLSEMTPRMPKAITYDQGWRIIDVVQRHLCEAIDHARRVEGADDA